MKYDATLKVGRDKSEQLEKLCEIPDADTGRDEAVFDEEVEFSNGNRMAIQVISSTEPDKESCWTQGVLFDPAGFELGCTNPGESFLGEYEVYDNEDVYCVTVISED